MATVFDVFKEVQMDYLKIKQSTTYGDRIVDETPIKGIFKVRNGESQNYDMELKTSTATAHLHPEDFGNPNELVGNGIRCNDQTYQIIGITGGANFATGQMEHLTATLEVADYVSPSNG